ncbi:MAG: FtsX-like permease family protein [Rikenellaceae bacterium]
MVRVATISVALSVALMTITLAIVFGFKREVTQSITGFTSHAIMSDVATFGGSQSDPIEDRAELRELVLEQRGALSISPYATLQGVVRSSESIEGVMLRGIDSLYDDTFLQSSLVAGDLPRSSSATESRRDLLLSESLAQRLGVGVDERLELIVSDANETMRRYLFKVCGLYATGLEEWDRMVMLTDLECVQRLNAWQRGQISGYEIRFSSLKEASRGCERINDELLYGEYEGVENIVAITTEELYPSIFDWLKAHNVNAVVVIVIMIIVAGFNMATALLILVLERTRMIGVLKSLGMNNSSLQRIFLYRALSITLKGLAWGNGVSLLICYLQEKFHLVRLDAGSYLLNFVPIELGWGWIVGLNVAVVATILALMTLPTRMVSKIKVEETLKFE